MFAHVLIHDSLHRFLRHSLLDLPDGLSRVQTLGTHFDAIHDGVTAEQFVGVVQLLQTFLGSLVAAVLDEAGGLQQSGRTEEFVWVPPKAGAGSGAAGAEDALVEAIQLVAVSGGLQAFGLGIRVLGDEVRLSGPVLLEEGFLVDDQITDHRLTGQGTDFDGLFQTGHRREAGQAVAAVDVHAVGAAHAFPAGTAETQGLVLGLQFQQGVQQHHAGRYIQGVFLHVGPAVLLGVVAVDAEGGELGIGHVSRSSAWGTPSRFWAFRAG